MPSEVHAPDIPPAELEELVGGTAGVEAAAEDVAAELVVLRNRGAADDEAAMMLVAKLVAEAEAVPDAKPRGLEEAPVLVEAAVGAEPALLLTADEAELLEELPLEPAVPPWHCPWGQQLEPGIGTKLHSWPPH